MGGVYNSIRFPGCNSGAVVLYGGVKICGDACVSFLASITLLRLPGRAGHLRRR